MQVSQTKIASGLSIAGSGLPRLFLVVLLGGILLGVVVGCEAENAVKRGDRAMGVGSHEEAYRQYQIAKGYKPKLVNDAGFVEKFNFTKSRAAYEVAQRRARAGEWEEALAKYAEAIEVDSRFELAKAALGEAKGKAAIDYHRRALGAADVDQLAEADRMLRRALELAPGQSQAREALDSIGSPKEVASWVEALADRDARRWPEAIGAFGLTVRDWPNHLPARAEQFRATAQLNEANKLAARGKVELKKKELDRAIGTLKASLGVWPFHAGAKADLTVAEGVRGQAEFRFDAAVGHAEARRWDNAIVANNAALKLFPGFGKAKTYSPQLQLMAANDMLREGEERLAAGDADGARDYFNRSLGYEPGHKPAKMGLSRVSVWRGDRAATGNRWGEALLWYMEAETHYAGKAYRSKIDDARARVLGGAVFGLGVAVLDDRGNVSSHSLAMEQRLNAVLSRTAPGFVQVGAKVVGGAGKVYHSQVTVTGATIQQRVTKTEKKRHRYTTVHNVPNPHVQELRHEVAHARGELAALEFKFHERCHVCGGGGYSACGACGGRGRSACTAAHGEESCAMCGGSHFMECSTCGGGGRVKCSHCGGSGKRHRVSSRDVERAHGRVQHLEHDLLVEPLLVEEVVVQWWPYEVRHHVMEGLMRTTVGYGFDGSRGGKGQVGGEAFDSKWVLKDAEILGANPGIGLGADPLVLAAQGDVVTALLDDAAGEASRRVLAKVVGYRVSELLGEAAVHRADGKGVEELETRVVAALVLESVDGKGGRKMLAELRPGG